MAIWDTLIGVGGNLASSWIGSNAADNAADQLASSNAQALQVSDEAIARSRGDITSYGTPGLEDIISGYQGAIDTLQDPGLAEEQALAFTGVLGPQRQQEAYDTYHESAGQQYLRDQQEEALLRNSAAIGGLGGGRVRSALQEQAYGRAATNQQQYLNNIMGLIQPEQQRSANISNILSGGGENLANYRSSIGGNLANVSMGGLTNQIPLITGGGSAKAAGVLGQNSAIQSGITGISSTLGQLYG